MYFIDEVKIFLKAGDGGNGSSSFRREKFVEYGGPDGGNGGKGGDIIVVGDRHINTLVNFRHKRHFKAKDGENGSGAACTGANGSNLYIKVPLGTEIHTGDEQNLIIDIVKDGEEIIIANGGRGGAGNINFKTSVNQAPHKAKKGKIGNELIVYLKLKLLCDVGLIGMPNAGKSTFLSVVTSAKPKIADYPFTTLIPQLGVAYIDYNEIVIADIPGLIEGASKGHGLGDKFLRHIERCRVLLHLIDASHENVVKTYTTIHKELIDYKEDLGNKIEIIALNKVDLLNDEEIEIKKRALEKKIKEITKLKNKNELKNTDELTKNIHPEVMICSSATNRGITEILRILFRYSKNIDFLE